MSVVGDSLIALTALAGIVGVILLLGRVLRASTIGRPGGPGRLLEVRETIALDPRRRLHVVRCGDASVLLLTGGSTDVVVGWVAGPGRP